MKRSLLVLGGTLLLNAASATAIIPRGDNFDDNQLASMWKVFLEEPRHIWIEEVRSRLEVTSTEAVDATGATVICNGWGLSTADDFRIRADAHHERVTESWSEVYLGIGYKDDFWEYDEAYIEIALGCDEEEPGYWYEQVADELLVDADWWPRYEAEATLYMSYDASLDELYLSTSGYGVENAWKVIPGTIRGQQGRTTVKVGLGGYSEGVKLSPGEAWLDNFVIDEGTLCQAFPADINGDCKVDLADLALLAENWLACTRDPQSACE